MTNKKVIITGTNGFIGNKLVDYYLSKEYEVIGFDISKSNIKHDKFTSYEVNLEQDDLFELYSDISADFFIHCAGNASVPVSVENPTLDFNRNLVVLYNTLLSLKKLDKKPKFIFLSSAAVYGNPKELPIKEELKRDPISPYGLHKNMCEDLCVYFNKINKMDIKILRIFSAYGEGLKKQILWDMYNKIKNTNRLELFGTGNESRDFIHVDDIVKSIDLVLNSNEGEIIYNLANGKEVTIRQLAETFAEIYGLDKNYIFFNGQEKVGDPNNWRADISKLKDIGYISSVSIEEGIDRYIKWVKSVEE